MSLSYACTCRACEKEFSVPYYSSKPSERDYCEECLPLVQQKKREEYFRNKSK